MTDTIRADFESKFPVPAFISWNVQEQAYYLSGKCETVKGAEAKAMGFLDKWVGWQAAHARYAPREAELEQALAELLFCCERSFDWSFDPEFTKAYNKAFNLVGATKEPQ